LHHPILTAYTHRIFVRFTHSNKLRADKHATFITDLKVAPHFHAHPTTSLNKLNMDAIVKKLIRTNEHATTATLMLTIYH